MAVIYQSEVFTHCHMSADMSHKAEDVPLPFLIFSFQHSFFVCLIGIRNAKMGIFLVFGVVILLIGTPSAHALSREIGRDIKFPKGYDAQKAKAILSVVQDERFKFVGGL